MAIIHSSQLKATLAPEQVVIAADYYNALEAASQTIDTSYGQVEYATEGEGPVVIAIHGGPGGFDQGLGIGKLFSKNGYRVIAPSRPGYLQTELKADPGIEDQAECIAALMDRLEIPDAIIVGASAGGIAAYAFAQQYPERTNALITIDGLCTHYTKGDDISKAEEWIYLSKPGNWLLNYFMKHFPEASVKSFLQTESTLSRHEMGVRAKEIAGDPDRFALLDMLFSTMMNQYDARKQGVNADLALGHIIDRLPMDNITAPSLIIEGSADGDVLPHDAEYAHNTIAHSDLLWVDTGSHIGFWTAPDAYKAQKYTLDWLTNTMT